MQLPSKRAKLIDWKSKTVQGAAIGGVCVLLAALITLFSTCRSGSQSIQVNPIIQPTQTQTQTINFDTSWIQDRLERTEHLLVDVRAQIEDLACGTKPTVISAVVPQPPEPSVAPKLADLLAEAVQLNSHRNYERAAAQYRAALEVDEACIEARKGLALSLHAMEQTDAAIDQLREAIRESPDDASLHCFLGELLAARGASDAALAEIARARSLDPTNPEVQLSAGMVYYHLGEFDRALSEFHRALGDPSSETYFKCQKLIAAATLSKGNTADVMASLEVMHGIFPSDTDASNMLALALARLGQTKRACDILREAVEADPTTLYLLTNYAKLLAETEQIDEAVLQARTAVGLAPNNPTVRGLLGAILINKGNIPEALKELTEAARLAPENSTIQANLGTALLCGERWQEADVVLKRAIALGDSNPDTYRKLGLAELNAGRPADARQSFRRALKLSPAITGVHGPLGAAYLRNGETQLAIREFRTAIQEEPENAQFHSFLADALALEQSFEEAIQQAHDAIRLAPNTAFHHAILGFVLVQRRDFAGAIRSLVHARGLDPTDANTYILLAYCYVVEGRRATAIAHIRKAVDLDPTWRKKVECDPAFKGLHRDEVFQSIIREPTTQPGQATTNTPCTGGGVKRGRS